MMNPTYLFFTWVIFGLNTSAKWLGEWGLENFAITSPNDDSCTYNFRIIRGVQTPDQFYRHTDCIFTINRDLDIPASQVNLTNQLCEGTDEFKVNSQWNHNGSISLCIIHEISDSWAFFGYETSQILNANASWMVTSPCYQIGTFNDSDRPPGYPGDGRVELWSDNEELGEAEKSCDLSVGKSCV